MLVRPDPVQVPSPRTTAAGDAFVEYFGCPAELAALDVRHGLSDTKGYFAFADAVCYGLCVGAVPSPRPASVPNVEDGAQWDSGRLRLPFDLAEVVTNLQEEKYRQESRNYLEKLTRTKLSQKLYYSVRPILPVAVRKHLQKVRLSGWEAIAFPRWPVDFTVDTLMRHSMRLLLEHSELRRIPFVWFWPEGRSSGVILTHDVEASAGLDFCGELMDLDDSFGIKSAFQLIPEDRYTPTREEFEQIRRRGFEANVHDLNHDGYLFQDRDLFLKRAAQINKYVRQYQSRGFRAGAMYRNLQWLGDLDIAYDMSVPNVAHLEPQRGGCCAVLPYFVDDILEIPLTTIQDYSLFHIVGDYTIDVWKTQIELILARNGLLSFLAHPDYLIEKRARDVYSRLLTHLSRLRAEKNLWMALPGDVDTWWRNRRQMKLVRSGESWRVEGPDSARASVAYATLEGDRLVYELE